MLKAPGSDTEYQIVTDFKNLNSVTVKDRYPLPRIKPIFGKLESGTIFNKIDLKHGYWQINLVKDSRKYTSTITPIGICNAASTFMRLMDFILRPLSNFAAACIDDIIAVSRISKEQKQHLHQVFSRLQKYGLTINPSKTHLGQDKLSFLGHEITSKDVAPLLGKVQAISDHPKPATIKQLRAFVNLVHSYHSCLENFAEAVDSLTEFLSKRFKGIRKVPRDKESEMAFKNVKKLVCQVTLLAYPIGGSKLILKRYASDLSTGWLFCS